MIKKQKQFKMYIHKHKKLLHKSALNFMIVKFYSRKKYSVIANKHLKSRHLKTAIYCYTTDDYTKFIDNINNLEELCERVFHLVNDSI